MFLSYSFIYIIVLSFLTLGMTPSRKVNEIKKVHFETLYKYGPCVTFVVLDPTRSIWKQFYREPPRPTYWPCPWSGVFHAHARRKPRARHLHSRGTPWNTGTRGTSQGTRRNRRRTWSLNRRAAREWGAHLRHQLSGLQRACSHKYEDDK